MAQRRPNQFQVDLDDDQVTSAWKSKIASRLSPAAQTPPQNKNLAPSSKPALAPSTQSCALKNVATVAETPGSQRNVTFQTPDETPNSPVMPAIGRTAPGNAFVGRVSKPESSGMASSRYASPTATRDHREAAISSASPDISKSATSPARHPGRAEKGSAFGTSNFDMTSGIPQAAAMPASTVGAPSTPRRTAGDHPSFNLAAREFQPGQPSIDLSAAASQAVKSPSSDRSGSVEQRRTDSRRTSGSQDRPGLSYQGLRPALSVSVFDDYDPRQSLLSRQAALEKKIQENQARKQSLHERAMAAVKQREDGHPQEQSNTGSHLRGGGQSDSSPQRMVQSTTQSSSVIQPGMQKSPEPKATDASKDDWEMVGTAAEERRSAPPPPPPTPARPVEGRTTQPVRRSFATPGKYGTPKAGTGIGHATSEDVESPLSIPTPASWDIQPSNGRGILASTRPADMESSTAATTPSPNPFQQIGDRFRRRVEQATPGRLPVQQSALKLVDMPAASLGLSNTTTPQKPSAHQPSNVASSADTLKDVQRTSNRSVVQQPQPPVNPATPLIDVSTPQIDRSLKPKPPPGGLAEDSSTFFGGVGRAMAAFKETQKAPARATNSFPNQEHIDYFAAYPKPEKREGPPAGSRRVKLENLPRDFTARNVADLVYGGQVERLEYSKGDSFAKVTFLEAEAAKAYYDDTANGISIASHPGLVILVEFDPQVMPATAATKMCLEKSISRVVRAIGVDKKLSIEDIKNRAKKSESKDVTVEHLTVKQLASGVTAVEFRMCSIQGAVYLARSLRSDPDWEQCNVQYAPDPCATAKGPRTSS